MNPIKSSITTSNAPDNIIMGASRFTKPLLLKVIGAFGIMILLLVILTIFSLTNLNKGKDASRQALDLQARATVLQRLREAIVSERLSILNMLYTGVAAPNLKVYQDTFDQQSIELLALGGDPFTFKVEHTKLIGAYEAVIKANQPGPAAQARELWKI